MTTFIWDLDGTLLDSYPAILDGLEETYERFGLSFDREGVRQFILQHSVKDLLAKTALEQGLDAADLEAVRATSLREKNAQVVLMTGAREVLDWTREKGIANFIYTHKGDNTFTILESLGLSAYFQEVLTSQSGFARKPDPEALNYLVAKYRLDKSNTYYIGDRLLDAQTAIAAGIGSFNLTIRDLPGNQFIQDVLELKEYLDTP